ncbi:MAG: tRNA lysidine(34) synthetase TilS [Planctomycetota bacterium]
MTAVPERSEAMCRLRTRLERFLRRHRLLSDAHPVLIAVSGGVDSTALALAAAALWSESGQRARFVVAHVDHAQRDDSAAAAEAVARFAARLGIAAVVGRVELRRGASEATLRDARYSTLADLAQRHSARVVLTAHHRDDQIETILLRMFRGTGLRGLCGMRSLRPIHDHGHLGRPFLGLPKSALAAAVAEAGFGDGVAPDPSNADPRFARNALRAGRLPQLLTRHGRDRLDRLARAAISRQRRFDRIDAEARAWIDQNAKFADGTAVVELGSWPTRQALGQALLQHLCEDLAQGWPMRSWTLRALALATGRAGRHLDAHPTLLVTRRRDTLVFRIKPPSPGPNPVPLASSSIPMGGSPASTLPYCPPPRIAVATPRDRTTEWPLPSAAHPEDP